MGVEDPHRISFTIVILIIVGLFWYVDSIEYDFPKNWLEWYEERFFLLKLAMIVTYYGIIIAFFELVHRGIKCALRFIMRL